MFAGAQTGDNQCDLGSIDFPQPQWRLRTLVGGFATEEFGRSMVGADFNCDG